MRAPGFASKRRTIPLIGDLISVRLRSSQQSVFYIKQICRFLFGRKFLFNIFIVDSCCSTCDEEKPSAASVFVKQILPDKDFALKQHQR